MEDSKVKARVICNPASSGGGYEPEELHGELEGYELELITTESPGDAREASSNWRDGHLTGGNRQRPGRYPRHTRGSRRGRGRGASEPGEDPRRGPGSV
jgi:hypothetical protein